MFEELVKEITKELEVQESRGRARSGDAQGSFEYAVRFILTSLWRDSISYLPRYRDNKLTYRQVKAAFDALINCRFIEITIM
jgi:hypothetical protein